MILGAQPRIPYADAARTLANQPADVAQDEEGES